MILASLLIVTAISPLSPAATMPQAAPTFPATWAGWGPLRGEPTPVGQVLNAPADAPPSVGADGTVTDWRVKFFVFQDLDLRLNSGDGFVFSRYALLEPQMRIVRESIARMTVRVRQLSGGRLRLVPDVQVLPDNYLFDLPGANPRAALRTQLRSVSHDWVNNGVYEAEDKRYRGPYQAILTIVPAAPIGTDSNSSGAPALPLAPYEEMVPLFGSVGPEDFEGRVLGAIRASLPYSRESRARLTGFAPNSFPAMASFLPPAGPPTASATPDDLAEAGTSSITRTSNLEAATDADAELGEVLRVRETGFGRSGRISAPTPTGGLPLGGNRFLVVRASTSARDRTSLIVNGDVFLPLGPELNMKADGTWETLSFDLGSLGVSTITSLAIGPSPQQTFEGRRGVGAIDYRFASFRLAPSADGANAVVPTLADRIAAARTNPGEGLKDAAREVQVAALEQLTSAKSGDAFRLAQPLINSIDARVGVAAVDAVASSSAPEAVEAIRQAVQFALTRHARLAAARRFPINDPRNLGVLLPLVEAPNAQVRIGAAKLFGEVKTNAAGVVRMTLLRFEDPNVKVAVIQASDPASDYEIRRVLWSSVNEPYDQARLAALQKLVQSPLAAFRSEGLKGIRDDSIGVRASFAEFLGQQPKAADVRNALLIGVVDSHPLVRAASLRALVAQSEASISLGEIEPLYTDDYAVVLLALLDGVKQRRIALSDSQASVISAKGIPVVQAALESRSR